MVIKITLPKKKKTSSSEPECKGLYYDQEDVSCSKCPDADECKHSSSLSVVPPLVEVSPSALSASVYQESFILSSRDADLSNFDSAHRFRVLPFYVDSSVEVSDWLNSVLTSLSEWPKDHITYGELHNIVLESCKAREGYDGFPLVSYSDSLQITYNLVGYAQTVLLDEGTYKDISNDFTL